MAFMLVVFWHFVKTKIEFLTWTMRVSSISFAGTIQSYSPVLCISNAFELDSPGFFLGRMLSTMKSGRSFYIGLECFSLGRFGESFSLHAMGALLKHDLFK